MPTQYFIISDKQAAKAQNAAWWEKILGRAKNPEDVTEFLFAMMDHPITSQVLVVVQQPDYDRLYPLLTPQQKNFVDSNILQASNLQVVRFLAALAVWTTGSLALRGQAPVVASG